MGAPAQRRIYQMTPLLTREHRLVYRCEVPTPCHLLAKGSRRRGLGRMCHLVYELLGVCDYVVQLVGIAG